ncbi:MAG TPA: flagellin [Longimicrobiales bacterium]|nr:flagellin [Longimicrobiales bacterium]
MRITNATLAKEALSGFQAQMRAVEAARREATTGLRVSRPSDDPLAVAGVMQSSSGLRALEQYRRNLEWARSRLDFEDSVADQLGGALERAKELAVSQVGATASAATRAATAQEVTRLADFAEDLANTRFAGSYLFGGQHADRPPFVDGATDPDRPPSGSLRVEAGAMLVIDTNHSAQELFVDTGAIQALRDLAASLEANDARGVATAMSALDRSHGDVQKLVGDLGARMNHVDVALTNLDSLEVNLQTFRSSLEDADLTAAVTRLVERQGALEAAMLANSKILNLALTDYLR